MLNSLTEYTRSLTPEFGPNGPAGSLEEGTLNCGGLIGYGVIVDIDAEPGKSLRLTHQVYIHRTLSGFFHSFSVFSISFLWLRIMLLEVRTRCLILDPLMILAPIVLRHTKVVTTVQRRKIDSRTLG